MLQPITKPAHIAHEIPHRRVLVLRNEIANDVIEVERRRDYDRGNRDADQPVKNSGALHK